MEYSIDRKYIRSTYTKNVGTRRLYLDILDQFPNPIWMANAVGMCDYFNKSWLDFTGKPLEDQLGSGWVSGIHKDDLERCLDTFFRGIKNQKPFEMKYRLKHHSGKYKWICNYCSPYYDMDCFFSGYIGTCYDISYLKKAQDKIRNMAYEYQIVFNGTQDAMFLLNIDKNGAITVGRLNKAFSKETGLNKETLIGKPINQVFDERMALAIEKNCQRCVQYRIPITYEQTLTLPAGKRTWHITLTPVINKKKVLHVVGSSRDITEKRQREEKIKYLSYHDKLTGLYNRAYFEEQIKEADRKGQLPFSIIMGDLNGLKMVNDAFGHSEGDKLLKRVALILQGVCRQRDIVCRIGGDEFVVLLPGVNKEEAMDIMARIKNRCKEEPPDPIQPSIALGLATKDDIGQDMQFILKQAEDRMYHNKLLSSKEIKNSIISTLMKILKERTHETEEHSRRLKKLSTELGKVFGLTDKEINELELLSFLHDIGKISIPRHILHKKGKLTADEWDIVKRHCEIGYRITAAAPELATIAEAILSHHECWDGSGYPLGLKGETIPITSRIISVVDAFDAMTNPRSYRSAMSKDQAIIELRNKAGTQFDPRIVKDFINIVLYS
ncbi:MAG: HD domain-containing phosphohydrolase [Mahellales bacterium]|jgi:diguanylate cyclase (GGDEF)-like protein/PAS domain S-box-containing protein